MRSMLLHTIGMDNLDGKFTDMEIMGGGDRIFVNVIQSRATPNGHTRTE